MGYLAHHKGPGILGLATGPLNRQPFRVEISPLTGKQGPFKVTQFPQELNNETRVIQVRQEIFKGCTPSRFNLVKAYIEQPSTCGFW
jgi:hypothetical protein